MQEMNTFTRLWNPYRAAPLVMDRSKISSENWCNFFQDPLTQRAVQIFLNSCIGGKYDCVPTPDIDLFTDAAALQKFVSSIQKGFGTAAKGTSFDSVKRKSFLQILKLCMRCILLNGDVFLFAEWDTQGRVSFTVLDPASIFGTGVDSTCKDGIFYDALGAETAYLVSQDGVQKKIPAFRDGVQSVLHIFNEEFPGQLRGISPLVCAQKAVSMHNDTLAAHISKIQISKNFLFAEKTQASTCLPGEMVFTGADAGSSAFTSCPTGNIESKEVNNAVIYRTNDPQSSLDSIKYDMHGIDTIATLKYLVNLISSGMSIPYSELLSDYGGVTFSSARVQLNYFWESVLSFRSNFCDQIATFIYQHWLEYFVVNSKLSLDAKFFSDNREGLSAVIWDAPRKPSVDELKQAKADALNSETQKEIE